MKLNIEDYRDYFDDRWFEVFTPFLESVQMESIIADLKARTQRGKIIFPYSKTLRKQCPNWESENTLFRAFKECKYDDVKVVFVGLSPYFTIDKGVPVADGLAFSTKHKVCPPSLRILYNAIEEDIYKGLNLNMHKSPDLTFLANQGVLLLNAALTCEPRMPTIHIDLWKPFMLYFIQKVLNTHFTGLHIVFWGEEAQAYKKYVNAYKPNSFQFNNFHYVYEESHPAAFARSNSNMMTNIFSTINQRLIDSNGKEYAIKWDKCEFEKPEI